MTRRLVLAIVLLSSCGPKNPPENPSTPSEDAAVVETSIAEDASVPEVATIAPPDGSKPACPATFAAAQSSVCILAMPANAACEYPEGTCHCAAPPQCGGAYMMHPPGSPGTFACSPKSASVPRIDGCPWSPPKNGSACSGGKSCTYGPCSWSQTIATCKGGAWNVVVHQSPPPP